jgi:uncharacterized protein (TIGR00290 family)
MTPNTLISWSGGKDSCLALFRARQNGMAFGLLITAMDEVGAFSRSHGVPAALMQAQAASLGLPLRFYCTTWQTYEAQFIATLQSAKADGMVHAVFGDIDLQAHRDWEEKVCAQAGLQACLPLWQQSRQMLVDEFLQAGFKAVVVCVNGRYLGPEFCGREFDAAFLADLPPGVDACGENGEFHTFVYDGPGFAHPVAWQRGEPLTYQSPPEQGDAVYYFQRLIAA